MVLVVGMWKGAVHHKKGKAKKHKTNSSPLLAVLKSTDSRPTKSRGWVGGGGQQTGWQRWAPGTFRRPVGRPTLGCSRVSGPYLPTRNSPDAWTGKKSVPANPPTQPIRELAHLGRMENMTRITSDIPTIVSAIAKFRIKTFVFVCKKREIKINVYYRYIIGILALCTL